MGIFLSSSGSIRDYSHLTPGPSGYLPLHLKVHPGVFSSDSVSFRVPSSPSQGPSGIFFSNSHAHILSYQLSQAPSGNILFQLGVISVSFPPYQGLSEDLPIHLKISLEIFPANSGSIWGFFIYNLGGGISPSILGMFPVQYRFHLGIFSNSSRGSPWILISNVGPTRASHPARAGFIRGSPYEAPGFM
jgi:hypothetical protein